ncbi:MAG: APC family permease, partial [Clostridia bacterium]|nr:APC family permease [Clostridia bacterium]
MEKNMLESNGTGLKKQLSPMSVWALAFGCVIGWGSFINPGKKFLPNSGVAGTAIAMVLGALVMIIIAFSYAYLIPKYPKAGGEFTFTRESYGKIPAFICGWFLVAAYLTNVPMNSTAIPLIVEGLFGKEALAWGFNYEIAGSSVTLGGILIAGFILILFGVLNILGVRKAAIVQTILSSLLIICVFSLFIGALCSPHFSVEHMNPLWGVNNNTTPWGENENVAVAILATFAIAPWAFVGFDTIPQASEEFKFSYKKVIFIMIIAIAFGCFVYVSNNTVTAAVLEDWPEMLQENGSRWLLLEAAGKIMGTPGKILVGTGVSCAVLSGIMGFYLASSRLMYSMSKSGYLPAVFGKLDKKHGTPKNAMIFCVIISLAGPVLGREALGWFVDMSAIGASI